MILKLFVCFLISTSAHAAIMRNLDEMKVIEVPISQEGLTRIKVQEDRILHVFGNGGEYVLEMDENQGQIFIRPLKENSKSISITLTTEAGHTQDLRLLPRHQTPEAIILKTDNALKQEIEKDPFNGTKRASAHLFREEIEGLMQALQEERIPLGYKELPINLMTLNEPYQRIREIQGQTLRGVTYRINSKTQKIQILSESEVAKALLFKSHTIVAILIPKKTLKPGEETYVYIVARAN